MTTTTSAAGRAAIRDREGCRLTAYQDSVGVWTVGCGHTGRATPPAVHAGMKITAAEADAYLLADLVPFEAAVREATAPKTLTQNQFDACVSLAFNIGSGAFRTSTVARLIREGNIPGAADAFLMWNRAGNQVLQGLVNRRKAERAQFLAKVPLVDVAVPQPAPTIPPAGPVAIEPGPTWWTLFLRWLGVDGA